MISVACALIYSELGLFLAQRKDNKKWEFPGGKLKSGESINSCIIREVKEELNSNIEPKNIIGTVESNDYKLIFIECFLKSSLESIKLNDHINFRWINSKAEFQELFPMILEGDLLFIKKFRKKIRVFKN